MRYKTVTYKKTARSKLKISLKSYGSWLDYGARMYDPVIGRFWCLDPMSGAAPNWSPYRYAFCNPVLIIDPNGMWESIPGGYRTFEPNEIRAFIGTLKSNYRYKGNALLSYNEKRVNIINNDTENKNWDAIYGATVSEYKDNLEAYMIIANTLISGYILNNLVICSHGSGKGGLRIVGELMDDGEGLALATDMIALILGIESKDYNGTPPHGWDSENGNYTYLNEIYDVNSFIGLGKYVKQNGNIILTGCMSGNQEADLARVLSLAYGQINLYMNQDRTNANDKILNDPLTGKNPAEGSSKYLGWVKYNNGIQKVYNVATTVILNKTGNSIQLSPLKQ